MSKTKETGFHKGMSVLLWKLQARMMALVLVGY